MSVTDFIHYYRSIMPNPQQFKAQLVEPLPVCFWANSLKITPAELQQSLAADGLQVERLPWTKVGFRYQGGCALGKSWQYMIGLLQIQEEVSMLPGELLNAQAGEKILDLCAAPGNKTAQISVAMANCGTLIANDRNYQRMRALGQISKRLD